MKQAPCLFNHLNQAENPLSRMYCTIYSAAINLKYNTWIELDQEDIMFIADECIKNWTLDVKKGWSLKANFLAVFEYVRYNNKKLDYKIFSTKDKDLDIYLDEWFMVEVGISVNKAYLHDAEDDWVINDHMDYKKYTEGKRYNHATSLLKWNQWSEYQWKYFIFDSYFDKHKFNLYEVNKDEMVEDIMLNNNYLFFLKD